MLNALSQLLSIRARSRFRQVALILSLGFCVPAMSFAQDQSVQVTLTQAIRDNDLVLVRNVFAENPDVEMQQFRPSPLSIASSEGQADIVQFLISQGMDPLQMDSRLAPIHIAASKDHVDVVQVLLEAGVPIELRTKDRWEPPLLMHAASNNAVDTISFLVAQGANIDVRDKCNDPPIAASAYYGHREATLLLIDLGANLTTASSAGGVCSEGSTAVSYAISQGHMEIADILRAAGAVEKAH